VNLRARRYRRAVSTRSRLAISATIAIGGWWLSHLVRHLVAFAHTNPSRLGIEMLGIEIGLAALATAIAFALPGPVPRRLGLSAGRLSIGAVIALAIGTLGLSQAIDAAVSLTLPRALEHSVVRGIARGLAGPRGMDYALSLIGTVIGPAIGEELLCRGLLQRALVRWIHPAAAVAIASLVFGKLHQEAMHATIAACLGLYLGLAAYRSDSTRPAIACHAANNFGAWLGSIGWAPAVPFVPGISGGLGLAAIGIVWAWHAKPRGENRGLVESELQPDPSPTDA